MDKKPKGEIALSELPTEEQIKEFKEWFKKRIEHLKEQKIRYEERHSRTPEGAITNAKWSAAFAYMMYYYLIDIFELMESIIDEIVSITKETNIKTSKIRKQVTKLTKELESHKPIVRHIEQALEDTAKAFEENR